MNIKVLTLVLFTIFFLSACNFDEAKKMADEYYDAYNNTDYDKLATIVFGADNSQMVNFVKSHFQNMGKVESYENYNVSSSKKDNQTLTSLSFKCEFEKSDETIYERLTFIETEEGLKFKTLIYSEKQWFVDEYDTYNKTTSDLSDKYFKIIKNDDLHMLAELVEDTSIVYKFKDVVLQKKEFYGKVVDYELITSTTFLQDNSPFVVRNYECKTEENELIYEQLVFKRENEVFYVISYNYADTLDKLP